MINASWTGGKVKTGKLVKSFGTHSSPFRYGNRLIEVYDRPKNGQGPGIEVYGTKTWGVSESLPAGKSVTLPVGSRSTAIVHVAASNGKGVNEAAQFMVGADGKVIKVSGTNRTGTKAASGKLSLLSSKNPRLVNDLGTDVNVVMTVFWK